MTIKSSILIFSFILVPLCGLAIDSQKLLLDPNNLNQDPKISRLPQLYSVINDSVTIAPQEAYLPNRVYTVYVDEKKFRYFSKTNSRGKFLVPLELLDANTVVPGPVLGGKDPAVRYKLSSDWKWTITKAAEETFLWVLSEPQVLKHIQYRIVEVKK